MAPDPLAWFLVHVDPVAVAAEAFVHESRIVRERAVRVPLEPIPIEVAVAEAAGWELRHPGGRRVRPSLLISEKDQLRIATAALANIERKAS